LSPPSASPDVLTASGRALASRFDDFRGALGRRDEAAYRMALADLLDRLVAWSGALDRVVVPTLERIGRRDLGHELRVDLVQLRELTRHLLQEVDSHAPMSDVLGLVENLSRRLAAWLRQMSEVYGPAAIPALTKEEWAAIGAARPPD
jgi:hypothetical protein